MKRSMVLNLNEIEMKALDEISERKGLNKTAVIKQALKLYQAIQLKLENGEKIYFEGKDKDKSELVLL